MSAQIKQEFEGRYDEAPGVFALMKPMDGAIEAVRKLVKQYDVYVLSTAPWLNSTAWSDNVLWIQKYFGEGENSLLYKRLIISHHKNLNSGAYLIDDRTKNGAELFKGEHIHFGTQHFPDWNSVLEYLGVD